MTSSTGDESFRFEDEETFRAALEIAELADAVAMRVRRDRPWAASQLGRSSLSIVANTAEGHGEHSPGDKARFYRYACRSATETAAILRFLARIGLVSADTERRLRALLLRVIQTLTRRAIHFQRRAGITHR